MFFMLASDILTLKKDTAKAHYKNVGIPNNAPLVVYQAIMARHWLVMGLKTDTSLVDT
jgi:hypothetical protein